MTTDQSPHWRKRKETASPTKILSFYLNQWRTTITTPMKWGFLLLICFSLLSGMISTSLLALISQILDLAEPAGTPLVLLFLGLTLALPIMQYLSEAMLVRWGSKAVLQLRLFYCRNIMDAPFRLLEKLGPSRLLVVLHEDIFTVADSILSSIVLITQVSILSMGFAYLCWYAPSLFLWVIVGAIIGFFAYRIPAVRGWEYLRKAREVSAERYGHFHSLTFGNKEFKINRRLRRNFRDTSFQPSVLGYNRLVLRGHLWYASAKGWGQIIYFFILGLLIFVVPQFQTVAPHQLVTFGVVLLYLTSPLQLIMDCFYTLGRAGAAVEKIESLELELTGNQESVGVTEEVHQFNELVFTNTTYSYQTRLVEHQFVFGPVDLSFKPGQITYVVGGNGSGKTTFAKLLVGLYRPDDGGRILLDGKEITEDNLVSYRQLFSTVFSDFFLFESLLGLEKADLDERATHYLKELEIDHKVQVQDGRLSTTDLSQGQRKRLALLTAYLEDRPFYVFDEWAADQDPLFREIFYHKILPELKSRGKAVLVISHDDKYFARADRLITLDYGKVESDVIMGGQS